MVVPPGYGVGDIIAIANLGVQAWKVYKKCKAALEIFRNISTEVLSMHDVLKEVEEALDDHPHPLPQSKLDGLNYILAGSRDALSDLEALLGKYESLGTQSKRTWK